MTKLLFSVFLLSCSLVSFQLVLMQFLSIVQWYHFAYMVISVALLGFGASGTALVLWREWFQRRADVLVPLLMVLSATAIGLATRLSQFSPVRFDSYLLFVEEGQVAGLVLTYLLFFLPFFFGALAIGLLFVCHDKSIGKIYAANLAGSGAGGVLAIGLMWLIPVQRLSVPLAMLAVVAALILLPEGKRKALLWMGATSVVAILYTFALPAPIRSSEYKGVSRSLTLPNAAVVSERSSPFGLVQVVSSPLIRYAPGLSLTYKAPIHPSDVVFSNGDWFGPIFGLSSEPATDFTTSALPYVLEDRRRVLVLQARTGVFAAHAIQRGATHVVVVESHRDIVSLLQGEYADASDSLFLHPSVQVHNIDPRSFILTDTSQYDLIMLPTLDAFGGTSGLFALQEQYLLTKEAFEGMWQRLAADGAVCITSWMDHPPRNPLRALSTIVAMLSESGVRNAREYVTAIRSWGTITFLVKRTPLTERETHNIREFCAHMQFDPLLLPGIATSERNKHNVLYDSSFFRLIDGIMDTRRDTVYAQYDFRISPATDDRPYFSQFLRWDSIPRLREYFGQHALPFLELGSVLIAVTLVQITVLALLLIIVPLLRRESRQRGAAKLFVYFGSLGLGYMFVEIVLIQRFILYFGNPLYAAGAVISGMLLISGAGSTVSSYLQTHSAGRILLAVASLLVLYTFALGPALVFFISLPLLAKVLLSFFFIAPAAFLMGMPFPLGMRMFGTGGSNAIAWAWGINGCASVIAAPLAVMVALEGGFTFVTIAATGMYVLAAVTAFKARQ